MSLRLNLHVLFFANFGHLACIGDFVVLNEEGTFKRQAHEVPRKVAMVKLWPSSEIYLTRARRLP